MPETNDTEPPSDEDLEFAISVAYGKDPHLGDPDPRTIRAMTQGLKAAMALSKARRADHANEDWIGTTAEEHMRHAADHAFHAFEGTDGNTIHGAAIDEETRMYHGTHAMLRIMFALARLSNP